MHVPWTDIKQNEDTVYWHKQVEEICGIKL